MVSGSHLKHLWNELVAKYKMMKLAMQKVSCSGTGWDDLSSDEWTFFTSMQFMEVHIEPRSVQSSLELQKESTIATLPVKAPPLEEFTRKRRAKRDAVDNEWHETNKLVELTLENMLDSKHNEPEQEKAFANNGCLSILQSS